MWTLLLQASMQRAFPWADCKSECRGGFSQLNGLLECAWWPDTRAATVRSSHSTAEGHTSAGLAREDEAADEPSPGLMGVLGWD